LKCILRNNCIYCEGLDSVQPGQQGDRRPSRRRERLMDGRAHRRMEDMARNWRFKTNTKGVKVAQNVPN
jgi:hypothetical protein